MAMKRKEKEIKIVTYDEPEPKKTYRDYKDYYYGSGSIYSSYTSLATPCYHAGEKPIVVAGRKALYGASGVRVVEAVYKNSAVCVVDLANVWSGSKGSFVVKSRSDSKFHELESFIVDPAILTLDWPDGTSPPVGLVFWQKLWELLPEGNTVVSCVGGHGRTGTFLAAMAIALGMKPTDAIDHVRKNHCEKAIETLNQEEYLLNLK